MSGIGNVNRGEEITGSMKWDWGRAGMEYGWMSLYVIGDMGPGVGNCSAK